jgi:bacteriorhodopsin
MIRDEDLYSRPETWVAWRINWGAIWVGALAALSAALIFGLLGTALGATSSEKISSWHTISMIDVSVIVCAAFFSFVIGGWVAGKITGARHSEPTILHAAIAWLVATPILVTMLAAGAGTAFGGWYGGLIASPDRRSRRGACVTGYSPRHRNGGNHLAPAWSYRQRHRGLDGLR